MQSRKQEDFLWKQFCAAFFLVPESEFAYISAVVKCPPVRKLNLVFSI